MEVQPSRSFCTLMVNSTNAVIYTPKHAVIGQYSHTLTTVVDPGVLFQLLLVGKQPNMALLISSRSAWVKIHLQRTKQYETVGGDWQNNTKIEEEYNDYREAFPEIMEPFQVVWSGHFESINTSTHHIRLTAQYI